MTNEAEFKKRIKVSIKHHGGFAVNLASVGMSVGGLPDIYAVILNYGPVLLEAKWLKDVGNTFKRKINYSALQKQFLKDTNSVYNGSAYGIVGFAYGNRVYACLIQHEIETLHEGYISSGSTSYIEKGTPYFDIPTMFKYTSIKVPTLNENRLIELDNIISAK